MTNGFSVTSTVSLRPGKGLNLKLLAYARPAFGLFRARVNRAISVGLQLVRGLGVFGTIRRHQFVGT